MATQSHTNNNKNASNAVDGNATTCMQSNPIGVGTSFPHKTVWWRVDLGRIYSIYSINIQFGNYHGYGLYFFFTIYAYVRTMHLITLIRSLS